MEDHAHILFALSRDMTTSKAAEVAKKSSSKWLKKQREEFADFAWQGGYGAFSVSESNTAEVRNYIAKQRKHHRRISFFDEYRELLKRHKIVC